MQRVTLACNAMATRFELVLVGENPVQLRGAGEEALAEIERIEGLLSLYRAGSEIAGVNAHAATESVKLSPEVFHVLVLARHFYELTGGSFDPTVGPLVKCWGFMRGNGARPGEPEIDSAASLVGFDKVELDDESSTIRFSRQGMMIDLGSIGKGYALDRAAEILRDAGVENALLHGGASTVVALGSDPAAGGWKVAIEHPREENVVLAVVELRNESLSVSALRGKFFESAGKIYGHVIDPRTGRPAQNALMGTVILPEAIATDALSTAVLLAAPDDLAQLTQRIPGIRYMQAKAGEPCQILSRGIGLDKCLDNGASPSV